MPVFYDTHAHLDDESFRADLPQVIERAHAAGIEKIMCIGTNLADSEHAIQFSEQYPNVFAAVGWHPCFALEAPPDLVAQLRKLAQHPKVKAIGEIGMDYYWMPSTKSGGTPEQDEQLKKRQVEIFNQQLELAAELGLNCVVHQREAMEDTLKLIQPFAGRLRAVFHCFSSDATFSKRILDMNFLVSYTGTVTYKNAPNVRKSMSAVPLGKFMLETDCPYMIPEPYRGKVRRNEPMHVQRISEVAAEVKGCSLQELSDATCRAANEFFKLP